MNRQQCFMIFRELVNGNGINLHDIAREIEFTGVHLGLAELNRGERIPIEEVECELPSWIIE